MASKGTFSATQRATAPNVQFGQTVRQITSDIETRRRTALQEDLATQSRKAAATKEANRIRKEDNENADKFNKLASKMLGVDASGVMSNVLTESLKINQGRYAELREEYNDASPERQTEIKAEIRGYNASVENLNQLGKSWSTFFNDYNSKLGQKGGYSAYGSGKRIYDIANTLYSASKQGLKRNKDGTYNMGEFVTIENLGKPNMKFKVVNDKGEQLSYTAPQNIINDLGSGLKPYQDVEGLLLDFNKVSGNFTYLKNFDPTSDVGNMTKVANVDDMKANINTLVENKFANNPDLVNEIIGRKIQRKNANGELMVDKKGNPDLLDSKEEIMQHYEDQTFLLKKRSFDNIQKHNPNYKNEQRTKSFGDAKNLVMGTMQLDPKSIGKLGVWGDSSKVAFENPKVMDISKIGGTSTYVVKLKSGKSFDEVYYDMDDANEKNAFYRGLAKAATDKTRGISTDQVEQFLSKTDLSTLKLKSEIKPQSYYDAVSGLDELDNLVDKKRKNISSSKLESSLIGVSEIMKGLGYKVEVDSPWVGANNVVIRDAKGEEIKRIRYSGFNSSADAVDAIKTGIMEIIDKTPAWEKEKSEAKEEVKIDKPKTGGAY